VIDVLEEGPRTLSKVRHNVKGVVFRTRHLHAWQGYYDQLNSSMVIVDKEQ
jgi:hypothetical protein